MGEHSLNAMLTVQSAPKVTHLPCFSHVQRISQGGDQFWTTFYTKIPINNTFSAVWALVLDSVTILNGKGQPEYPFQLSDGIRIMEKSTDNGGTYNQVGRGVLMTILRPLLRSTLMSTSTSGLR